MHREDKDLINDTLYSEKNICKTLATAITESATCDLRDELKNVLNCEFDMQNELFTEMSNRGWYPVENAEQQKISQAKSQFQQQAQQMGQQQGGQMGQSGMNGNMRNGMNNIR